MKSFTRQPYIETISTAKELVVPDNIYISIRLDEMDLKNRISVERLEEKLMQTLQGIGIDIEKDLSLLSLNSKHKTYFIKNNEIAKVKLYSLIVHDAVTAGRVLSELEKVDIANVSIEKTEYSQEEALFLELKGKAIIKAKESATQMTSLIDQKIGKALHIQEMAVQSGMGECRMTPVVHSSSLSKSKSAPEPIFFEFKKIKFEVQLKVRFALD